MSDRVFIALVMLCGLGSMLAMPSFKQGLGMHLAVSSILVALWLKEQ